MSKSKKNTVTAWCIATKAFGKDMFVMDSTQRELDKKEVVELTADKQKSKPFETEAEAETFVTQIHNPFERVFKVLKFEVPAVAFIRKPLQGSLI